VLYCEHSKGITGEYIPAYIKTVNLKEDFIA